MASLIENVQYRLRMAGMAFLFAVVFTPQLILTAEARQLDSPQLTWPVTYPEYFIEDYILDGTIIIREDERAMELIQGMSHAGLRVTRNAVFARHGLPFESPDLNHYFTRRPWYQATDGPITLTRADSLNVAFILELEKQAPEPPDFDALFTEPSLNELREINLGTGSIHGGAYIPAEYVRTVLNRPDYAFEFDYMVFAPFKKFTLRNNETLYLFTVNFGVGQTFNVITQKSSGDYGPPVDIDLFVGDQEVGSGEPVIYLSRLFIDTYGTLYIMQIQSQDYETEIGGQIRYVEQEQLLVRAHRLPDLMDGNVTDVMSDHNEKETVLYILYNEVNDLLDSLLEHEFPEIIMAHQLKPILTKTMWIIGQDEMYETDEILKALKVNFPDAFQEALAHYKPHEQAVLRDAVK